MPGIYTKTGDDGTTGLLFGGRVLKDDLATEAYGTTDEAVAVLGLARSLCQDETVRGDLLTLQRELFVVGADLATNPPKRNKLKPEVSLVTEKMVARLEQRIDDLVAAVEEAGYEVPRESPEIAEAAEARELGMLAERGEVQLVGAGDHHRVDRQDGHRERDLAGR